MNFENQPCFDTPNKSGESVSLASDEGITTNILADRLKRLEQVEILEKTPYQHNPVRYDYYLTPKGQALAPLVMEMVKWGLQYIPGTGPQPHI